MKDIGAVLATFAIFIFSWMLLALLLTLIGYASIQSGHRPGVLMVIHFLATWVLCPGIGAGVAVFATSRSFMTVSTDMIFTAFVSICAAIIALLLAAQVGSNLVGDSPLSETVIFILQAVSIFLGALVGRRAVAY